MDIHAGFEVVNPFHPRHHLGAVSLAQKLSGNRTGSHPADRFPS